MATFQIKRRISGAAGAPSALKSGELAVNMADNTLYCGFGDDGSGNATSIVSLGGIGAFLALTGNQTIGGVKTFSESPIAPTPAGGDDSQKVATTAWVKSFQYASTATRLDQFAAPTAPVGMNNQRLTDLGAPTQSADAVTKSYVDNKLSGLAWKEPARAATTANITLSGEQTIDGVACVTGDRVLVKDQTTGSENGVYVVSSGAWSRASDFDEDAEAVGGAALLVQEGATYADKAFSLSNDGAVTIGATALTFVQITGGSTGESNDGANVGTGGTGIFHGKSGVTLQFRKIKAKSGAPISVALATDVVELDISAGNGVAIESGALRIDAAWAGQTSITTLGTISTGTWQGTPVAMEYGGTGVNLTGLANGSVLKKTASGVAAAVAGTDFLGPNSVIDGGTF